MMSFKRIAEELECTEAEVVWTYYSALKKIREATPEEDVEAFKLLMRDEAMPDETLFEMYVRYLFSGERVEIEGEYED